MGIESVDWGWIQYSPHREKNSEIRDLIRSEEPDAIGVEQPPRALDLLIDSDEEFGIGAEVAVSEAISLKQQVAILAMEDEKTHTTDVDEEGRALGLSSCMAQESLTGKQAREFSISDLVECREIYRDMNEEVFHRYLIQREKEICRRTLGAAEEYDDLLLIVGSLHAPGILRWVNNVDERVNPENRLL